MSLAENSSNKISSVKNETDDDLCKLSVKSKGQGSLEISGNYESNGTIPKAVSSNKHNEENTSEISIVKSLEALKLSPTSSDDNICKVDWLKAKDSLENLIHLKGDVVSSRSTSCTSSKDKCLISEYPHSETVISSNKSSCPSSVSKVLSWDPWEKLGRKNKKENKRRKQEKSPLPPKEKSRSPSPQEKNRRDFKSGDEASVSNPSNSSQPFNENYEYQPYQKNLRSVDFTNKVMVVYINEDKVIAEVTEPLKKELEQQERNKEMRKGHMADIQFGKRKIVSDWFRK